MTEVTKLTLVHAEVDVAMDVGSDVLCELLELFEEVVFGGALVVLEEGG